MPTQQPTDGYPPLHHARVRSATRANLRVLLILGLITSAGLISVISFDAPSILAALPIALLILFGIVGSLATIIEMQTVRIIPYFEKKIGGIETYLSGHQIARNLSFLDQAAIHSGVPPLSQYGFADDLLGETLTWYEAANGLRTVTLVLENLPDSLTEKEKVREELEKLRDALSRAEKLQIRFCLLLQHGNSTSGHEWDLRQGTAF